MEYVRIKYFLFREQLCVIRQYYRNIRFALVDSFVGLVAFVFNPFRISRKFLQKRGEADVYTYGETPLRTFHQLAQAANLTAKDRYIELGSGRGKTCFWTALFIGCPVQGIDWIPFFIRISRFCSLFIKTPIRFIETSFLNIDLSEATVVYFYGIHMDTTPLLGLFAKMPPESRLITISEPLDSDLFEVTHQIPVIFPWGETEGYIQVRKH